jgi:SpoVK/Ycf46/Vps4 family AAA+-type ATPase
MYDLTMNREGQVFWMPTPHRDDDILRFPDAPIDEVVAELERFWDRAALFAEHGLPHKRGILLHGPPGSGKSCTLLLIARDVIARGGLVVQFTNAGVFLSAYRGLRSVQPDTPVVVLMEDLDEILGPEAMPGNDQSRILNMLDGAERMHRVVFVATTNYPERLGPRVVNRPSRFDRRILVPHPGAESRRMYLKSLLRDGDGADLEQLVKGSEGMSLAHCKELFVSTVLLGNSFDETVKMLRAMRERPSSAYEDGPPAGFAGYA